MWPRMELLRANNAEYHLLHAANDRNRCQHEITEDLFYDMTRPL
jgi:hypothetical protein